MTEDSPAYLHARLQSVIHTNEVLLGAIDGVLSGARTLEELRAWREGPRSDSAYSWRAERKELLDRIAKLEARA